MDEVMFKKAAYVERSEHPDYKANYVTAQSALKNLSKLPGMRFKLEAAGGQGSSLPWAIFMISWCHQDLAQRAGTFAHPVFLHQSKEAFSYELSMAYETISKLACQKLGIIDYQPQDMF